MQDETTTDALSRPTEPDASQTVLGFDMSAILGANGANTASTACLIQIHPIVARCGVMHLDSTIIIGRETTADYHVADESVSREHARIERSPNGQYKLVDLNSTNGTFVNDVRIREWDLTPGDIIRCGGAILKLLPADDLEAHYHEVAYQMMTHDSLTGIHNRTYFEESLERELARSTRYQSPVSVLMLDVDHFKLINDKHGHLVGDELLREFADRSLTLLRGDSVLARVGGEEFAVLVPEADLQEAIRVAVRLREGIASRRFTAGNEASITITVSIGVATTASSPQMSVGDLMRLADDNLYEAKRQGRDRVYASQDSTVAE